MGFDVDAFIPDSRTWDDPGLSAAFAAASKRVVATAGGVDGFLDIGSLDCSQAIGYLSRGLGRECRPDMGIWLPEEVRACDGSWLP